MKKFTNSRKKRNVRCRKFARQYCAVHVTKSSPFSLFPSHLLCFGFQMLKTFKFAIFCSFWALKKFEDQYNWSRWKFTGLTQGGRFWPCQYSTYVLENSANILNAEIIFPAITLINIMRIPMMFLAPAISNAVQVSSPNQELKMF